MEGPRGTTRTPLPDTASQPLILPADTPLRGRAGGAPLRREGPEKLTGLAKYADDLVFPGAWYGATIRSTEPHARLLGIDLDDGFDWSRVVVVTADDIPGENVVSLIDDDQPVLVPVGGEIRHQAEPVALIAAADRVDGARGAPPYQPAHRAPRTGLRSARERAGVRPLHRRARRCGRGHGPGSTW